MNTMTVPFYGDSLYVVNHNGEPYVPMKPIVEGMGLNWKTQFRKLQQRFKGCVVEMTTQLPGDSQRRNVVVFRYASLLAGFRPSARTRLNRKFATGLFSTRTSVMMFSMTTGQRALRLILAV